MGSVRRVRVLALLVATTLLAQTTHGSEPWLAPWVLTPPPRPDDPVPRTLCGAYVLSDPAAEARLAASTDVGGFPAPELLAGSPGLRLEGSAALRVRTGDKAELRLALVNETEQIVTVVTGAYLHAKVADRHGAVVWHHPPAEIDGIMVGLAAVGCGRLLLPRQPLEFGVTWDLTDAKGQPVPPGEYAVALSIGRPELAAAPFRIAVAGASVHPPSRTKRE